MCAAWLTINFPLSSLAPAAVARCPVITDAAAAPQPAAPAVAIAPPAPMSALSAQASTDSRFGDREVDAAASTGGSDWVRVAGITTVALGVTVAAALWWRRGGQGRTRAALRGLFRSSK